MKNKITAIISELEAYSKKLDEGCISYWYYHKKRYLWFIEALVDLIDNNALQKDLRILDIAPLYQTLLMSKLLPDARVDTIGYGNGPFHPQTNSKHIQFDL